MILPFSPSFPIHSIHPFLSHSMYRESLDGKKGNIHSIGSMESIVGCLVIEKNESIQDEMKEEMEEEMDRENRKRDQEKTWTK